MKPKGALEHAVVKLSRDITKIAHGSSFSRAATVGEISRFQKCHNTTLPFEAKRWFGWHNGANLSIGGLYSLFSSGRDDCSINWYLNEFPEWKKKGWLPIANDGCGDLYILVASITISGTETHPIVFLDQSDDYPSYLVASGLWQFLLFFFEKEILIQREQSSYWPFDKERVISLDPKILECKEIPLPWETHE